MCVQHKHLAEEASRDCYSSQAPLAKPYPGQKHVLTKLFVCGVVNSEKGYLLLIFNDDVTV